MLMAMIGHTGRMQTVHDALAAWHFDPLIVAVVVIAVWLSVRARRPNTRRAQACAGAGAVALVIALLSPLHELSGALASAHMVQHVLLMLGAAPLIAVGNATTTMVRRLPRAFRAWSASARKRTGLTHRRLEFLSHALVVAAVHAGILWLWHTRALYEAAVRWPVVHAVEHAMFFVSALLFWRLIAAPARRRALTPGQRIVLLFAMAMQGVFLAVLLTFAPAAWYPHYEATTPRWGLDPLTDQHLAGVIMWVPAGMIYVAAALMVASAWLRDMAHRDGDEARFTERDPLPAHDRPIPETSPP